MPWTRRGGKHVFFSISEPAASTSAPTSTSSSAIEISTPTGSLSEGMWAEWADAGSYKENSASNVTTAVVPVTVAAEGSTRVAGVVTGENRVMVSGGVILAWVLRKKRTLELSGLYSTSENGVHVANTAIIQRGNFFVMARSKDDELQTLADKFAELTNS